jgi:5-bromo-4-chloroindolyl phosphate hydrolysis protein
VDVTVSIVIYIHPRVSARKKLVGTKKKTLNKIRQLKMLNSASECLKITLKVIKFSKPEKKFPNKLSPYVKFMPGVIPPLCETLHPFQTHMSTNNMEA